MDINIGADEFRIIFSESRFWLIADGACTTTKIDAAVFLIYTAKLSKSVSVSNDGAKTSVNICL